MIFESGTLKRLFPYVLWVLFSCVTAVWMLIRPMELSFDFQAEKNCTSQLIFSCGKSFSAKTSRSVTVTPCKTRCVFSLPERTCRIRLTPGKRLENSVTIRHFSLIRNGIFRNRTVNPADGVLKPVRDVILSDGSFKVTGRQPELEVSEEWIRQRKPDIRLCSLAALLFLLGSAVILSLKWDDWCRLGAGTSRLAGQLTNYCRENRYLLIYMFCCLLLFFGYELFQAPISPDDDWYLLSKFEELENDMPGAYSSLTYQNLTENYICHGRWASALLIQVFTGFSPVISLMWSLFCLSVIFLLLAENLKLSKEARYLFFPLFIGHPIFYEYASFYMANNLFGFVFLVCFVTAVCTQDTLSRRTFLIGILVAAFCICALQSLIVIFPLWFLLTTIISRAMDRQIDFKPAFYAFSKLCVFCLLSAAVYFLSMKFSFWLFEVEWQYLGDFLQKPDNVREVLRFSHKLLEKMLSVYTGEFEFTIHGQLLLFLLMAAAVIIRMIRKKRCLTDILIVALGLAALLILPFAMDIAIFNTAIPVRSMVSFPLMMTGLCISGWRSLEDHPKLRCISGLLIVFVTVQYGILINQKAYASKLRYEQDMSILQSIKDRCYQIPEFTAELKKNRKIPMAVVGNLYFPKYRNFPMWNDSMLNCTFEPAVVINLHLLGETCFYPASTAEMKRVFPVAMSMPSWPAQGSVRYENGIMIVKLSEFNQFQCRQYGFPFRPVHPDNTILRLKKLPAAVKPVWSLNSVTLDSALECKAEFSGSRTTVKSFGWHSLRTKAVNADPNKLYYLHLLLQQNKKNGFIYFGFSDPDRYGNEIDTEVEFPRDEKQCILRVPGRYLAGPLSIKLGDLPGKVRVFEKIVLLECAGPENLLAP